MKALQFTVLRVFFVLTLFINSINPSSAATTQDTSVFDHYLKIQTSLAADDLESVKNASQTLATEIAKAPTKSLTASARKKLTPEVKALLASKDLESARKAFKPLSATLIDLNEAAKIAELKVAYCPMAKA